MFVENAVECVEISTNKEVWYEFNRKVLLLVLLNDNFYYLYTNKINLSNYFLKVFEWPWDIERGIKIYVFDGELKSFRYKINYMDFCSQFVGLIVGGVLLALILKQTKDKLNNKQKR